jgi:DNA adenine methylase
MQTFLRVTRPQKDELLDLATACVFLNRTNFSGILHAKPIGGISQTSAYKIDCRFNKATIVSSILSVAEQMDDISVSFGDGVEYLRRRSQSLTDNGSVVYVDPPYYLQGRKLYRYHYKDDDHRRLAGFLDASSFKWVVSYDNHPFIRKLFKGQDVVPIFLNYVVKQSRRAQELLISNMPLLKVQYLDAGPKRRLAIHGSAIPLSGPR